MCHFGKSVNHAHCATQSKCKRGHAHQNMVGPIEISQRPTAVTLLEIDFWISGQVCSFFYPDQAEAYTKAAIKYFARVESQYKDFWQNLVATFRPLFTCEKGTKCGDQVLSKVFVLWFYSRNPENFLTWQYFTFPNSFLTISPIVTESEKICTHPIILEKRRERKKEERLKKNLT